MTHIQQAIAQAVGNIATNDDYNEQATHTTNDHQWTPPTTNDVPPTTAAQQPPPVINNEPLHMSALRYAYGGTSYAETQRVREAYTRNNATAQTTASGSNDAPAHMTGNHASDSTSTAPRVKERDTVKMPPFPTVSNFNLYKSECAQVSVTGSGRPTEALQWFTVIESADPATLEDVIGSWESWDCKCLEALKVTLKGPEQSDLLRRINGKISERILSGKLYSYRAALRMVFDEFTRDPQRTFNRLLKDLEALVITQNNEAGLRQFYTRYTEIATMMRATFKPENEAMVKAMLLNKLDDQLSRVSTLKDVFMAHFHRNKLDPSVYNADWLEKQLTQYFTDIRLEKTEQRLDQHRKDINQTGKTTAAWQLLELDRRQHHQTLVKAMAQLPLLLLVMVFLQFHWTAIRSST